MQKQDLAGPFVDKLSFLPKAPVNIQDTELITEPSQQPSLPFLASYKSILNTEKST